MGDQVPEIRILQDFPATTAAVAAQAAISARK